MVTDSEKYGDKSFRAISQVGFKTFRIIVVIKKRKFFLKTKNVVSIFQVIELQICLQVLKF